MAAEELGGRMHDDVGTVLQGTDEVRRAEGVIDDERYAMLVGHGCYALDVEDIGVGVAEGLGIYNFCVWLYGCFYGSEVVDANDGVGDALRGEGVGDEVVGSAIEVVGSYDVVPGLNDVLECIGDGRCSAGHGQSCYAPLECCHAILEDALRGVGEAAVDVAGIAQTEAVGSVLRVVEHIARGLVDGHGTCVGGGVSLLLSYMKLEGLEMKFVL